MSLSALITVEKDNFMTIMEVVAKLQKSPTSDQLFTELSGIPSRRTQVEKVISMAPYMPKHDTQKADVNQEPEITPLSSKHEDSPKIGKFSTEQKFMGTLHL